MSTAEITAYLAGVEIGRTSAVVRVDPQTVPIPGIGDANSEVFQAWRRLGDAQFRYWALRGVGDAWQQ